MIAFITLIYCGLIWLLFFKLKLLPFNAVAKVSVSVVGVAGILTLLIFMTMYQPYSTNLTVYQNIVQVAPQVGGRVVEVPVQALAPVRRDDVLFRIDPRPFQYKVDRLKAALSEAEKDIPQLKAALDSAKAAVSRATSERDRAKREYERNLKLQEQGAAADQTVLRWRTAYETAEAGIRNAKASEESARLAYESDTTVTRVRAELNSAQYDLEQTTVLAPADGFVADLQLRPGSMAQAQLPVIAFVDTSSSYAIVLLSQNAIRHIRAGNPAEVALTLQPGKIFNASVEQVVQASAQQTATGLISAQPESSLPVGTMAVRIKFETENESAQLPSGANGAVAIYTDSGKALRIIRKVIIRMFTWMNFLP